MERRKLLQVLVCLLVLSIRGQRGCAKRSLEKMRVPELQVTLLYFTDPGIIDQIR